MSRLEQLLAVCQPYQVEIIYAFGSQAKAALAWLNGTAALQIPPTSDVDIGVKTAVSLSMRQKAEFALALEDLWQVRAVDLLVIDQIASAVAFNIVSGELLWAQNSHQEAEYQLYIMRRAADFAYLERKRAELLLGMNTN